MSPFETVINMTQTFLQGMHPDGDIPQDQFEPAVLQVLQIHPQWQDDIDIGAVVRELETRFNIWVGDPGIIFDEDDHVAWLDAERSRAWSYWPRYRRLLERSSFPPPAIESIDLVTTRVLQQLEDPEREGPWDRRGMVVGHVQSGKTATYTGLISKAADAGYKVIVVLAGAHNSLRSQTQLRLEEGFLGYQTLPDRAFGRVVGVGLEDRNPELRPDCGTHREERGDLNRSVVRNLAFHPGGRPLLFVVKKNAAVLRNLLQWIGRVADRTDPETSQPIIANAPLILIDDEADHSSVDTGVQGFNQDGEPDENYAPRTINRLIRQVLKAFDRSAYVGFTATPFANIFIHEQAQTLEEGSDLFPRSFIVNLPAPSNHIGPTRVFGYDTDDELEETINPLGIVRHVDDHAASLSLNEDLGWMPPRHRSDHRPVHHGQARIPESLRVAILAYILSGAARRARGQRTEHNSMLIHVTRFIALQREVARQVETELSEIRNAVRFDDGSESDGILGELRQLWDEDYVQTTRNIQAEPDDFGIVDLSWTDVESEVAEFVEDLWINRVRQINGSAGDVLDYEAHAESGLNIIAIGGEKLSRGLTLEGLTVSYFLRSTKMYDTLMQMGRWFGYRPGYVDLCRLYTTPDLEQWFQHITEASEELRQEFDHMQAVGGTPRQYGLRVQAHPTLMVTSRVKMRNHTTLELSFAGSIKETVVFHSDPGKVLENFEYLESLLAELGTPDEDGNPERERPDGMVHRWSETYVWNDVAGELVTGFIDQFTTHPDAVKVDGRLIAEYMTRQMARGELGHWTVALVSGGDGGSSAIGGLPVSFLKRAHNERCYSADEQRASGRYIIGRLLAPRDEAIDLDRDQYASALASTISEWTRDPGRSRRRNEPSSPSGPAIRRARPASHGLLLLYPLDPDVAGIGGETPVVGFGCSFPDSENAETVTYQVNNVYWSQEYGDDE